MALAVSFLCAEASVHILAVDDDVHIREIIPMITKKVGFPDVTTVGSGDIALELLANATETYECLLLDINMPGMDGIELCGIVRNMPAYRKTPIIMLTAMTDKDYLDRAFKAGATDYITKPFDIVELGARLRIVKELITARKQAAAITGTPADIPAASARAIALEDPVTFPGPENLVDYNALGNYLTQLSRAGATSSQVIAIKVDRISAIHERASEQEFLYALSETAEAIGQVLKPQNNLMAYTGNGLFMVVSSYATLDVSRDLESAIQSLLDDRDTEFDNGDPLDIEVSIGNPMRPNTSRTQGVKKTFERALARAENRYQRKLNEPRPLNIRIVGK